DNPYDMVCLTRYNFVTRVLVWTLPFGVHTSRLQIWKYPSTISFNPLRKPFFLQNSLRSRKQVKSQVSTFNSTHKSLKSKFEKLIFRFFFEMKILYAQDEKILSQHHGQALVIRLHGRSICIYYMCMEHASSLGQI